MSIMGSYWPESDRPNALDDDDVKNAIRNVTGAFEQIGHDLDGIWTDLDDGLEATAVMQVWVALQQANELRAALQILREVVADFSGHPLEDRKPRL